jgi:hypothetical protein
MVAALVVAMIAGLGVVPLTAEPSVAEPVVDTFVVGAATRSISPTRLELASGLYLGGYDVGPSYRADGDPAVHEDTSARAVVIGFDEQRTVLVTLDLVGMGNLWMRAIRNAIAEATGISARAVMVHVSHSHASLDFQGIWGGVSPAYRQRVVDESVAAVRDAVATIGPADLRVASAEVPQLHANRRGIPERRDDTLSVMQFTRPDSGDVVATVANYGAHPTLSSRGNTIIGTDFVGPARDAMEDLTGGGVALFVNGTLGDLSPSAPAQGPSAPDSRPQQRLGVAIATAVQDAMQGATLIPPGMSMAVKSATFAPAGTLLSTLVGLPVAVSPLAGYYDLTFPGTVPQITSTVTVVRLGIADTFISLVAFPGEPLSSYGMSGTGVSVRDRLGGEAQFLFATTNDSLGYIIPDDEWVPGTYEEGISLGRPTGPKVLTAIEEAIAGLSRIPLADFTDVAPGVSFDQGVDWLAAYGITQGLGGRRLFSPSVPVTRVQMALFLWRMMGEPVPDQSPCGFTDMVGRTADRVEATCWLKQQEITTGINTARTLFGPDRGVTREEMAGFLWRLASKVPGPESCQFVDAPIRPVFATGACWLKEFGITTGTNAAGTVFSPLQPVTRGQMAAFLFRLASTSGAWQLPTPPTALFP